MWRLQESIYEFKLEYWYLYNCDDHCYNMVVSLLIALKRAIKCFIILCKPHNKDDIF